MTRIVCMSDTHGLHGPWLVVPDGDILIHAGDFCNRGRVSEVASFGSWLRTLPHRWKVVVAGNHDSPFELYRSDAEDALGHLSDRVYYLQDDAVELMGVRIYGSPWQPEFCDWAFNLPRNGPELREKWEAIPEGLDILVTHGPPWGVLDKGSLPAQTYHGSAEHLGDELLAQAVKLKQPRLHVFGHIHPGYGRQGSPYGESVNAAVCDDSYYPINPIQVVDL